MAELRRFRWPDLLLFLLVVGLAGGLRAGYLVSCADSGLADGPLRVQDRRPDAIGDFADNMRGMPRPNELDVLIDNLQHQGAFRLQAPFAAAEEPTAHVSPGYPYCVAMLGKLIRSADIDQVVRWAQVALGALTAGLYFLFARRAFRSLMVGTLAGLFTALNPFWIISTATLDEGVLTTFLLAVVLLLGSQAGEKGGALISLLLGITLAGLALVRAALLPFSFIALVWFLLRSQSVPRGWLCALLAFLGFGIGLSSWTVRNYQHFNEPVPVVSSAYLHLWIGNNPQATGGPATDAMWNNAPSAELREISNQPVRYARLGHEVVQQLRDDPAESIRRRLMALFYFLVGQRFLNDGILAETTGDSESIPAWLQASYPLVLSGFLLDMLLLALIGWRWSWGWRWQAMPASLAVFLLPLPYILGHAEALSGPRLPLDGPLLCYAAFALCSLLPRVGSHLLQGPQPQQAQQES